jgi:hypothetical protein
MTISDKVKNSANITTLTLYSEGLFYKCYNEDAMIFVKKVKAYKVSAKFIKSVGANVYSIGFPVREVEKGHLDFENISEKIAAKNYEVKDKHIVFLIGNADAKKDYNTWTATIQENKSIVVAKEPAPMHKSRLAMDGIINMIKSYDLANSTPMQGLNFIQQLKMEVHKVEENNGNI